MRASNFKAWALGHPMTAFLLTLPFFVLAYLLFGFAGGVLDVQAIAGGILTGLISSLGTYALVQYFFLQRKTYGVKEWLQVETANVWIVPTYLEHESRFPLMKYYVVPPFDAHAGTFLTQLLRHADVHYPRRKIVGSHRFIKEILSDNLIIICLPERNQYARIMLGLYDEIYLKNQDQLVAIQAENITRYVDDTKCEREYFGLKWNPLISSGKQIREWRIRHFGKPSTAPQAWWQSSININPDTNVHIPGVMNYDYAMIVKGPNPMNPAASILCVCGIHGIGTLGGALYLYQNAQDLFRLYPSRAQSHLIEIRYTTKPECDNYLDSEILRIEHLHYEPLPDRL